MATPPNFMIWFHKLTLISALSILEPDAPYFLYLKQHTGVDDSVLTATAEQTSLLHG